MDVVQAQEMSLLEKKLSDSKTRLFFLVDYVTFSAVDMRLNRQTFQWHTRMPSILEEHRQITKQKEEQYQGGLKVRERCPGRGGRMTRKPVCPGTQYDQDSCKKKGFS